MFTASLHRPIQYSLQGVQAISGSDQYGGCPQEDIRNADLTHLYCDSGIGVISDGTKSIGDISWPGWASGLLTINRVSQNIVLDVGFQSLVCMSTAVNLTVTSLALD